MALWNHNDAEGEDWDNEDRVGEYEKNYRAYADEYENAGWEAPEEEGYAEGGSEPEYDDYPEGEDEFYEEGYDESETYEESDYDAGFDESGEPVVYDEEYETEGYEPAGEIPMTGNTTAMMFQGEIGFTETYSSGPYDPEDYEDYSEDGEYYEEGEYAEEEYYEEEEPVDYDAPVYTRKKTTLPDDDDDDDRGGYLEKVMLVLGTVAVFLVIVVGALFIGSRQKAKDPGNDTGKDTLPTVVMNEEMAGVGSSLDGITFIGEKGLLAALDARKAARAALEAAEEVEEPVTTDYQEVDLDNSVSVSMEAVSVLKDLKIKFTNSSTKKLIANVPFTLTVTDPSGKTISWTDDDQDGIIYHKKLTEGTYTIHVEKLSGEKYEKYALPADKKVEVKGEIKYEEVAVADEVLDASEVNEAVEDTARDGAGEETEPAVVDTVAFVESTMTPTYEEVLKSSLTNPLTTANLGTFRRLSAVNTDSTGTQTTTQTTTGTDGTNGTASVSENTAKGTITLSTATLKTYTGVNNTFTLTLKDLTEKNLTVTSSDENIAKATISGTTVTVTGVAEGSATVTVSSTENPTAAQTCTVKVMNSATLLKDAKDNQLMVLEGTDENGKAKYREATYGDYFNPEITKFYVVGQIKYTGWQTIEGATYYYTADGKVVTGSQIILGVRYEFNSDGTLNTGNGVLGIDVSKWNGNIDWTKVKNAGVKFVIIRVGYRGSTQGALVDDSKFASNIKGATAAGLKVGVYFFSQAVDEVEAVYEASMVLDRISGYKISYPVYIDVESSGGRGDTIDKDTRTAVIKAFCATIASKGYAAGVYSNKTWLTSRMDVSALGAYKIWLAQYATEVTYSGRYEMWQYTAKGSINGISGNVDLDLSYMSY